MSDDPRKAQEEHNTPNVEQTADEHTLDPSELISLALDFIAVSSALDQRGENEQHFHLIPFL
jgi:hypothetical protein